MSIESFQHFEELEDELWALKAAYAENQGFLSAEASADFLKNL